MLCFKPLHVRCVQATTAAQCLSQPACVRGVALQKHARRMRGVVLGGVRALGLYGGLGDLALLMPESLFEEQAERRRAPRGAS